MTPPIRIAFVDDDPNILRGISRAMRAKEDEWDMVFCGSGQEALTEMDKQAFDIIVTDMRMPGMDGVQLLTRIRAIHPSTIRIILSGYADSDAVLRTVGPAHIYLAKPCDVGALGRAIDRQLSLRALLNTPELRSTLAGLTNLPSLPQIYTRLQTELLSPKGSTRTIADIIAEDVAMTAEILKISNSAFFSAAGNVSSLLSAVNLLGVETIQALVLKVGIFRQFTGKPEIAPLLEKLTNHSMAIGALAEKIVAMEGGDTTTAKAAQIAGMLSDIGCLVLFDAFPERYLSILSQVTKEQPLAHFEEKTFGARHTLIGAYLLGLWGFSDTLVEALAYCDTPSACAGRDNIALTALHAALTLGSPFPLVAANHQSEQPLDMDYLIGAGRDSQVPQWRKLAGLDEP